MKDRECACFKKKNQNQISQSHVAFRLTYSYFYPEPYQLPGPRDECVERTASRRLRMCRKYCRDPSLKSEHNTQIFIYLPSVILTLWLMCKAFYIFHSVESST
jgi:hypothetical protein